MIYTTIINIKLYCLVSIFSFSLLAQEENINSRLLKPNEELDNKIEKEENPKSRILIIDEEKSNKRVPLLKKNKQDNTIKENTKSINNETVNTNERNDLPKKKDIKKEEKSLDIENEYKIKELNDKEFEGNNKLENIKIIYLPDSSVADDKSIENFKKKIKFLNKKSKITIRSYASKSKGNSSSFARRLSLSRALKIRNILLNDGFLKTNVFVRALGTEGSQLESQDIIILVIDKIIN